MKKLKRVGMEMAASATGGKFKMSYDGEVSPRVAAVSDCVPISC